MKEAAARLTTFPRRLARRHAFLTTLLLATIVMAGVYNILWLNRPDYFRIQSDLNVRPIDLYSGIERFQSTGRVPLPERVTPDIQAAASQLQDAYNAAQKGSTHLARLREEVATQTRLLRGGESNFLASQEAQMERYVQQQKLPYEEKAARIKQNMERLLELAGVKSASELPEVWDAISYAKLRTELAEQSLASMRAGSAARGYALEHLAEFQRTPQQRLYVAAISRLRALDREVGQAESDLSKLVGRVAKAEEGYRRAASGRLNFADFLYFSVGGATGANFGDISPNHTSVRVLYALQICLSIVLLALALEKVTHRAETPH